MCSDNLWSRTNDSIAQDLYVIAGLDGSLIRSSGHVCYSVYVYTVYIFLYIYPPSSLSLSLSQFFFLFIFLFFFIFIFYRTRLGVLLLYDSFFHLLILLRDFLVSCFFGSRRTVNVMDPPSPLVLRLRINSYQKQNTSFFSILNVDWLPSTSCKVGTSGNMSRLSLYTTHTLLLLLLLLYIYLQLIAGCLRVPNLHSPRKPFWLIHRN
jgi:hypothetical protein